MTKFIALFVILLLFISVYALDTKNPATIEGAVQQILDMKQEDATREQIAERVKEIADDRLINANSPEVLTESWRNMVPFGLAGDSQKHKDFLKWRDGNGAEKDYKTVAEWAWENKYGQCAENAAVVYSILKGAGYKDVRIINKPNHRFVLWGMDEEADLKDLNAYTDNVLVPDGWLGRVLKGDDIIRERITSPSYGPSEDKTPEYDSTTEERCGKTQMPCCKKTDACLDDPELACVNDVCKPCGRLGQSCCEGQVCRAEGECVDGKCAAKTAEVKQEGGIGFCADRGTDQEALDLCYYQYSQATGDHGICAAISEGSYWKPICDTG
ncbi:MAG: hypothetical protein ABIH34_02400 [Nanoarchaeota archaeon]